MSNSDIPIYGTLISATVGGALARDSSIIGGYKTVSTITDRDAISIETRKAGMAVFVSETELIYILNSNLETWTTLVTNPEIVSNVETIILDPSTVNNIVLFSDGVGVDFVNMQAVYVQETTQSGSKLQSFGVCYPENMIEPVMFGQKIYITPTGDLVNQITGPGLYKEIGIIIVDENGDLALSINSAQTTYTVIN